MSFFNPENHTLSARHRKIYAIHVIAYTAIDFTAAALFIVGSALFFDPATTYAATWLFLIGSIFFGLRPATVLLRELAYLRAGDYQDIPQVADASVPPRKSGDP